MANTYKNIVITPNIGNTSDPRIQFSGGNTTANTDINLYVYPTSNGTLSFEGSAGQLFSITNDLSNSLFAVSDVSGIPSLEVFANGLVSIAQYSGNVGIGNTTPAHRLSVNGAVALGNSTVVGFLNVSSTGQFGGNLTLASTSAIIANSTAGTSGQTLTSNGSAVYWATPVASVNVAAQYAWTNVHTFTANVTIGNSTTNSSFLTSYFGTTNPNTFTMGSITTTAGLNTVIAGPYIISSGNTLVISTGSRVVIV